MSSFVAKKSLGQNFLIDKRITAKIIQACQLSADETVLEIGPGQGVLTKLIALQVKKLIAIETDKRLYETLKKEFAESNVEVIHADFLKFDIASLPPKIKVVGNLPYYISTPIIIKILENYKQFSKLFITVQWEFGQRLVAEVGSKDYGSLRCLARQFSDVNVLFKIHPGAFRPIPKVDSCFVQFDLLSEHRVAGNHYEFLFKMIRQAFTQRRKTLLNALGPLMPKEKLAAILKALAIDEKKRPENLSLEDYGRIAELWAKS